MNRSIMKNIYTMYTCKHERFCMSEGFGNG